MNDPRADRTTTRPKAVREGLAVKVAGAGGKPVDLAPEEVAEVRVLIAEVGRHERDAIKHGQIMADKVDEIARLSAEVVGLERKLLDRARAVRDSFIAASLAAGNDPVVAVGLADRAMALRDQPPKAVPVAAPDAVPAASGGGSGALAAAGSLTIAAGPITIGPAATGGDQVAAPAVDAKRPRKTDGNQP